MRHRRRGFTLIEVLAVIGIMLVLIALLVSAYRHVSGTAARRETIAELHICRSLLTEYESHNGVSFIPTLTGGGPLGLIGGDMSNRSGGTRYSGTVTNTAKVMAVLLQMPANRTIVEAIQSKRILEPKSGATANTLDQGVVLLDGWGNPIIVVPATGLQVNILDQSQNPPAAVLYIVRTSGIYPKSSAPSVSRADRPFFASAGQDGDFSIGEDNVYSFQD